MIKRILRDSILDIKPYETYEIDTSNKPVNIILPSREEGTHVMIKNVTPDLNHVLVSAFKNIKINGGDVLVFGGKYKCVFVELQFFNNNWEVKTKI